MVTDLHVITNVEDSDPDGATIAHIVTTVDHDVVAAVRTDETPDVDTVRIPAHEDPAEWERAAAAALHAAGYRVTSGWMSAADDEPSIVTASIARI